MIVVQKNCMVVVLLLLLLHVCYFNYATTIVSGFTGSSSSSYRIRVKTNPFQFRMSEESSSNEVRNFENVKSFGYEGVPEEQRPATEYNSMRQSLLFNWASEETGMTGLLTRLGITYAGFFALVCYPIAGATFTSDGYTLQKIAAANVGDMFVMMMLLIRLYSGWGYVGSRLKSEIVEFEETGWYDGSIEYKTKEEKARDYFLYSSDVRPVEDRLKTVTLGAATFLVASCIAMNASLAIKPVFDEYNPDMLDMLRGDDKLAEIAARQSNGRPTYCDNRYYRAVANGGQGC